MVHRLQSNSQLQERTLSDSTLSDSLLSESAPPDEILEKEPSSLFEKLSMGRVSLPRLETIVALIQQVPFVVAMEGYMEADGLLRRTNSRISVESLGDVTSVRAAAARVVEGPNNRASLEER